MKLLPGLYQVAGERVSHRYDASGYLLRGKNEAVLIDCGCPEGYEAVKSNINAVGTDLRDIKYIFGTHGHYDHIGSAALFQKEHSLQVYLHESDRDAVEKGDPFRTTSQLLYGVDFEAFQVDYCLKGGEVFHFEPFTLEVIHTPGHTPGSVCYIIQYDDIRVLVAGDTLYGGFSKHIHSCAKSWIQSLEKLNELDVDLLVIGHSNPVLLGDAKQRIKEAAESFDVYYTPWFKPFYKSFKY